jgi:hypothetical protein
MITAILLIPALLYARLYSLFQQLVLSGVIVSAVSALYGLKNYHTVIPHWKENFLKLYSSLQNSRTQVSDINFNLDFSFLKNPLVFLSFAALLLIPFSISAVGIYSNKVWMIAVPYVFLAAAHQFVRKELQLLLFAPIALLGLYALVKLDYSSSLVESILLVFISLQIFSGNSKVRFAGIVVFLVYAVTAAIVLHSFNFLIVVSFLGFANKRFLPLSWATFVIMIILSAFNFYSQFLTGIFTLNVLKAPFVLLALYMMWSNRQHILSNISVVLLPVSVAAYFLIAPLAQNNDFVSSIERTYYNINEVPKQLTLPPFKA